MLFFLTLADQLKPYDPNNPPFSNTEKIKYNLLTLFSCLAPFVAGRVWDAGYSVKHLRMASEKMFSKCLVDSQTQDVDPSLMLEQQELDGYAKAAENSLHPCFYYVGTITCLAMSCLTNYLMKKYEYGTEEDKAQFFAFRTGIQFLTFCSGLNLFHQHKNS